ncbi:MAG: hypothetical protein ACM3UZ_08315 [Acidobacteriota bacterium]
MSSVSKVFLALVVGYLMVKGMLAVLMYYVTKQVETKSLEYQRRRSNQNDEKIV